MPESLHALHTCTRCISIAICLLLATFLRCEGLDVGTIGQAAVYFSPKGGAEAAIVLALREAQQSVLVQGYSFTSVPIAQAVKEAHQRGVQVLVVLDKSNATGKYSAATFLANAGLKPLIDRKHPIAHNKVMVIDHATVITGSFNFTKAAECCNAENMLVLTAAPELVRAYAANVQAHAAHSQGYVLPVK
jgi:phosphatidylserine/phosphatidylglycerophosphate/cardiolipin synthase-like enzyme